jgi:hypothetical protein
MILDTAEQRLCPYDTPTVEVDGSVGNCSSRHGFLSQPYRGSDCGGIPR